MKMLSKDEIEKWSGTHRLQIRNYSGAFGLIEFVEFDGAVDLLEDLHVKLYMGNSSLLKNRELVGKVNKSTKFDVTLVPAEHGDTDMGSLWGPNHCGLGCVDIKIPIEFYPRKPLSAIKAVWNKMMGWSIWAN